MSYPIKFEAMADKNFLSGFIGQPCLLCMFGEIVDWGGGVKQFVVNGISYMIHLCNNKSHGEQIISWNVYLIYEILISIISFDLSFGLFSKF